YAMRSPRLAVLQSIKYRVDGERVQVDVTGSATTGWSMWVDHSSAINTPDSPVKLRVSRFDPPVNGVRARVVVRSVTGNFTVTQRWNPVTNSALDFLNFDFSLAGPLVPPVIVKGCGGYVAVPQVSGLLTTSYMAAYNATHPGAAAAAAAAAAERPHTAGCPT
ncbi:hypothetical protein ABPG77_005214, partial [Micractinium sp. CCAP 211/92]